MAKKWIALDKATGVITRAEVLRAEQYCAVLSSDASSRTCDYRFVFTCFDMGARWCASDGAWHGGFA